MCQALAPLVGLPNRRSTGYGPQDFRPEAIGHEQTLPRESHVLTVVGGETAVGPAANGRAGNAVEIETAF
jgi:hypothetical protein